MTLNAFYEDGSRVLNPRAFAFVLESELKRAVRAQNFLTLVVLETSREWEGMMMSADIGTLHEVAQVVAKDVRATDVLGRTDKGVLALVLLDADFDQARQVIERLVARLDEYGFQIVLRVALGAACYPTHAGDADSLMRAAMTRPLVNWRRPDTAVVRN
ncbi:MAG: diguanylate cyclase [Vicinamibacterales bacterium]